MTRRDPQTRSRPKFDVQSRETVLLDIVGSRIRGRVVGVEWSDGSNPHGSSYSGAPHFKYCGWFYTFSPIGTVSTKSIVVPETILEVDTDGN